MKKIVSMMLSLFMCFTLIACSNDAQNTTTDDMTTNENTAVQDDVVLNIGVPKAPPALPLLVMMEQHSLGDNVEMNLDIWSDAETLIAMVQDGNHQIFAFPLTVVSKLYNKGMDVKLTNVCVLDANYFFSDDPSVTSFKDLKGKQIYCPIKSSPPDVITQYLIGEAGLKVGEDVTIEYGAPAEVANILASGQGDFGTMLEPFATMIEMKNHDMKRVVNFGEEWKKIHGEDSRITIAGMGATGTFLSENEELSKQFEEEYAKAVVYVNEHPDEAGKLAQKYLDMKAPLIEHSMPTMGLEYISAKDAMKDAEIFYQVLYDYDPKTIGGKIPDVNMYYGAN